MIVSSAPNKASATCSLRAQGFTHGWLEDLWVAATDPFPERLRQSSRHTDQRRPGTHERITGSDHRRIRLRLSTLRSADQRQQLRDRFGPAAQRLRVNRVVLPPALPDQTDVACMRHGRLIPQLSGEKSSFTHGECVPVSSAIRLGIFEVFFIASGLVVDLSSRITSPLVRNTVEAPNDLPDRAQ